MLTNLVRNLVQFNGASMFEKARLSATYKGDYEAPNENDLQAILLTLSGKDPETRPQIGYSTITSKLENSASKMSWIYLVKNLILLDRCCECRFFVQDISQLNIPHIQTFEELHPSYKNYGIDIFIRKYFNHIKTKSFLYTKKTSSFNISGEEKKNYFKSQSIENIFEEFLLCCRLHEQIMDLGSCCKGGLLQFNLNQYVMLMFLFTLNNIYSTQYISVLVLLDKLLNMQLNDAKKFKDLYTNYLKNNEQLISFINQFKYVKGYNEINTNDIAKVDYRIYTCIDEYIKIAEKQANIFGLPKEIQLDSNLNEDEIVVSSMNILRQSVQQVKQEQIENANLDFMQQSTRTKKTIIYRPPEIVSFEEKVTQYAELHPQKFKDGAVVSFKKEFYDIIQNNYSTDYTKIEEIYKRVSSVSPQRVQSVQKPFGTDQGKIQIAEEDKIQFHVPGEFHEEIFLSEKNILFFEVAIDFNQFEDQVGFDDFADVDDQ
ncbi:hypothetical protein pb186bvf_016928 [Paramecium bursaria]